VSPLRRFGGAALHGARPGRRGARNRRSTTLAGGPGGRRAALRGRNGGDGDPSGVRSGPEGAQVSASPGGSVIFHAVVNR
jgi:hypothetical protein